MASQVYGFAFSKFEICYPNVLKGKISSTENSIFLSYTGQVY